MLDIITYYFMRRYYGLSAAQEELRPNYFEIQSENNASILLTTVLFNRPDLIKNQYRLMQKNIQDPFHLLVADNSNDANLASDAHDICCEIGVSYVKLPPNPFKRSRSHGAALNWVFKKYIHKTSFRFFGFLDHDIFPIRPTSLVNKLQSQPCWGYDQKGVNDSWYIWPGLCIFRKGAINATEIDFLPGLVGDTGARIWKTFYHRLSFDQINWPSRYYESIREGDIPQSDMVEHIGDWLHFLNSSDWKKINNSLERRTLLKDILSRY